MANIDMPVLNASINCDSAGDASSLALAPKSSGGTGINLTGAAFDLAISPTGQSTAGTFQTAGTVSIISASAGVLVLAVSATAGLAPGAYTGVLTVTPSGGTKQLLANVAINVK